MPQIPPFKRYSLHEERARNEGGNGCTNSAVRVCVSQRTRSHILTRNICVAAWMITPGFPIEALTQNPGILIQKLF